MGNRSQHIRSEVPYTGSELKQIQPMPDGHGMYYCSVRSILDQLGIESGSSVIFLVNNKEAEFIQHDNEMDYERLKCYPGKTIVVAESTSEHPSRRPPPKRRTPGPSLTHTDPQLQNRPQNPAAVDNEHGPDNAIKAGKSHKFSLLRRGTAPIEKTQDVLFSGIEASVVAHPSRKDGYHCHVSEIFTALKLDTTVSKTYKYKVGGVKDEFKNDKQNKIDLSKKIKYYPGQVIEILEVTPKVIPSAPSDVTMIADRKPNRRRESAGADSQTTANPDGNSQHNSIDDGTPESGFKALLLSSRQGYCSSDMKIVNLTLTTALMARKVFEALADLKRVRELIVTLAWNFRKSDLSAMVKSLSQSSVVHLTLDLKDKNSWKRPKVKFLFGRKYQPLQDLYSNRNLQTFHLVGASRFGIRTNPLPVLPGTSLKHLRLRIRLDGKSDQVAAQSIIKNCPQLADLRLGGIYKSEMHPTLKKTIGELKYLEVFHLYGMEKNEHGGPILDLLGRVTCSSKELKELVLVNSNVDAVETQTLIRVHEQTLTTLVLDHATFQPPNLKILSSGPFERPLLQNLKSLHLHVYESTESLQLLARTLRHLSLTHLGLTQGDCRVVQDLLNGKSLLENVNFGSLHSLFLSGFSGPSLAPLWEAVGTTTGSTSSIDGGRSPTVGKTPLRYLSLENLTRCYDLSSQLRRLRLESLWVVADVKELECELNQLALSLDYSSLKKVALFRTRAPRGSSPGSYFSQLEGHLQGGVATDLTIRVGDFKKGSPDEPNGLKVLSYKVGDRGGVMCGPSESVCKDHNPRYHRYRWGMTGWSEGEAGEALCV
ncbi:unnamed protein product [Mortierella alpina]